MNKKALSEQKTEKQNYCCAICKTHSDLLPRNLAVDHCHTTGKVRGLLCTNCNIGLGMLKDSSEILNLAIKYLKS